MLEGSALVVVVMGGVERAGTGAVDAGDAGTGVVDTGDAGTETVTVAVRADALWVVEVQPATTATVPARTRAEKAWRMSATSSQVRALSFRKTH